MDDGIEVVTETDAVAALARKGVFKPQIITTKSGREYLILPYQDGGANYHDVSEPGSMLEPMPNWIVQGVTVQTTDSLVDYVKRFAGEDTSLFADIATNRIVAVIDYHSEGGGEVEAVAARAAHKATLDMPYSVEWLLWTGIDGKLKGQLEFARFLEENGADIEAPAAADLREACRDLQATRKVNFTKAVRTASNNENFEYTDETTATQRNGGVEIPSEFMLRMPIFFGGPTYSIRAFLRWEVVEGEGLKLGIKLHNPEHIRQAVFKEVVATAADQIDRPAYYGKI